MKLSYVAHPFLLLLMLVVAVISAAEEGASDDRLGNLRASTTIPLATRELYDIPKLYDCPPKPKEVKPWYCPWCRPRLVTTKVDTYNEIMDIYDGSFDDAAPKAIAVWLGKKSGKVGSFADYQLEIVFKAANSGNACVRESFEDTVCYTLHYSDYFNAGTVSELQFLKDMNSFRKFAKKLSKGGPGSIASATYTLMNEVIIPAMNKLIGSISFLTRIAPGAKFESDLLARCAIH